MKKQKISTTVIFALILTLSLPITLMASSNANAQTTIPTHSFISVAPNPIGSGQQVYVDMWLIEINPVAYSAISGQASGTGTGTATSGVWSGFTVKVMAPDGTISTLGPYVSSDIATVDVTFTPNEVGNYTFTFNFPGQQVTGVNPYPTNHTVSAYYAPSSATATLTVQQTQITALSQTPLPTGYWQRPIDWQNQNWYTISQNWFDVAQWNNCASVSLSSNIPNMIAPQTAHVVWTKSSSGPLAFGGQIGGSMFSSTDLSNYYTGKTYEYYFNHLIIINGVLYYNSPIAIAPDYGFYAINLRTGETLWYNNETQEPPTLPTSSGGFFPNVLSWPGVLYGEVYSHHNPNEVGGIGYLWGVSGSTYSMYDASTGRWILNVIGSTGGTAIMGPQGELLVYTLNNGNGKTGWLSLWNSTLCVGSTVYATNPWFWRPPSGTSLAWSTGIQWNVTVPIYWAPNQYSGANNTEAIVLINNGVLLATTGNTGIPQGYQNEVGYSATTGAFLWVQNRTVDEPGQTSWGLMGPASNGIYVEFDKATMQYYGFNILTGQQVWGPTAPLPNAESSFTYIYAATDKIFVAQGLTGLYAFNFADGTPAWSWTAPSAGQQTAFPTYPLEGQSPGVISAGGLIFVAGSNSHGDQLYRGAQLYAVNATNGKLVWSVDSFIIGMAAADGYVVGFNGYDNQIYCFGKGQSATTVAAPDTVVSQGTQVLIKGTVTDQSPGQTCFGKPAAGTPAISDDSMSDWMAYLYMQQTKPTNAVGVPVTLSVFDPNNNTYVIGTTTSDADGMYKLMWTPPVPGAYTVTASFAGSNSYYGSSAETALGVSQAALPAASVITPTPTQGQTVPSATAPTITVAPTPSPAVNPPTSASPTMTYLAVAVAVIIVAVVAVALVLRRRR